MRGSIIKRGNTYTIIYDIGKDMVTRKRKQVTKGGFKTKKEAEKALTEALQQINTNQYIYCKNVTFNSFCEEWLNVYCRPKLAPRTFESYESIIRTHLIPFFGKMKLEDIRGDLIQAYYNRYIGKLSNTTINYHSRLLKLIFKYAVKWEYLHRNPCDNADAPKKDKREMTTWNSSDIQKAREFFKDTSIYLHVILALWTGLRLGEICGLRWEDIDLTNKVLIVRRTQQRAMHKLIFKEPKTVESHRKVALTDFAVEALKKAKKEQLANPLKLDSEYVKDYEGYVSIWEDGSFKESDYVGKKFAKHLKKLKSIYDEKEKQEKLTDSDYYLPIIRFHDLRHTHASLLVASGKHPKIISERLGHTQIGITMDLYSHVNMDTQREAVNDFDNLVLQV